MTRSFGENRRRRWLEAIFASALLLGSGVATAPLANADPCNGNGNNPHCPTTAHIDDHPPDDPYGDALAPIDAGMGDNQTDGNLAATASCARHPVRFATDETGNDRRLQLVYVVPSDGTDRKLDQPQLCQNGTIFPHVLHNTHRNIARFLWLEYGETESTNIRLRYPTHAYATGLGTPRTLARVAFIRDLTHTKAQWNQATKADKLAWSRTLLINNGFNNANVVYLAVLEASQTTGGSARAAGSGYYDEGQWDGCDMYADGPGCYAYMLVTDHFKDPTTQADVYYGLRPGCANKYFDSGVLHEVSHVLGAVPLTAPNSDGDYHITTAQDVLHKNGYIIANSTGGRIADYDASTDDYRNEVRQGWFTTSSPPDDTFRVCAG